MDYLICFSPNGNTETAARKFCTMVFRGYETIDLTVPENRSGDYHFGGDDRIVFAFPTYAGRLPNRIMPFLRDHVSADGACATGIVTFGGRSFDNSLAELNVVLSVDGFRVSALAAFNAPHSMSRVLNASRPDGEDDAEIEEFADALLEKGFSPDSDIVRYEGAVKEYYTPLREDGTKAAFLKSKSKTNSEKCSGCGKCIEVCPMGSIDKDFINRRICIKCHACINMCPENARYFDDEDLLSHVRMLEKNFASVRRKNEWFV